MRALLLLAFLHFGYGARVLALKPDRSAYSATPATLGLRAEERRILTPDSVRLLSWTILPDAKTDLKTLLVLAYGDGGNMSYWLPQAAELARSGFTVVMFDYRGFGASDSVAAMDTRYLYLDAFIADLSAMCADAARRYPRHTKVLWGFSMGTIIGTLAWEGLRFDGFFGEGFVTDPAAVARRIEAMKSKTILLPESAASFSNIAASMKAPLHLLAGTQDAVTTAADAIAFAALHPARTAQIFEGGHGGGWNTLATPGGNGYVTAMMAFSKKLRRL